MNIPNTVYKALVEKKDLPSNRNKMLRRFALDLSICARSKCCAREFTLHDWRQHKEFLSRRGEESTGDFKERVAFILYEYADGKDDARDKIPLTDDPFGLMEIFNEKWKQGNFNKDDDLVADLCMRGLIVESRGGARLGAGTYALTEKGMRLSAPLRSKLAYYVAGEELSFWTWVRVLVFFIITEFFTVPILDPVVKPIFDPLLDAVRGIRDALVSGIYFID